MSHQGNRDKLVATLNALLESLDIPITLYDPLELTPFLILAIFESMLRTRLPIPQETRRSATPAARIDAMKVFLGVLEDDVLGVEVGLDELDPRRLADGEEEEVEYVGEVLCWLGRKWHYITTNGSPARTTLHEGQEVQEDPPSPSALSTSFRSSLSLHNSVAESQTTIAQESFDDGIPFFDNTFDHEREFLPSFHRTNDTIGIYEDSSSQSRIFDVRDFPLSPQKQRANRLPVVDSVDDLEEEARSEVDSYCECPEDLSICSTIRPLVRKDGYISHVDVESELRSFEAWREASTQLRATPRRKETSRPSLSALNTPSRSAGPSPRIITRHTSPAQHTLALLEERARLLSELATLKSQRR